MFVLFLSLVIFTKVVIKAEQTNLMKNVRLRSCFNRVNLQSFFFLTNSLGRAAAMNYIVTA